MTARLLPLLLACTFAMSGQQAKGGLILTLNDTPQGIRLEYSGTLDVSGLSFSVSNGTIAGPLTLQASDRIAFNNPSGNSPWRSFNNAFVDFPSENFFTQNVSGTNLDGSQFVIDGGPSLSTSNFLLAESDITSEIWTGSGAGRFGNATTLAGIGAFEGQYRWTLNNAARDSIVLTIGDPVAVPEPSSVALFGAGLAYCAISSRRRRRSASIVSR